MSLNPLYYNIPFQTNTLKRAKNLLLTTWDYGLNSTTTVFFLFFYKDGFGIKYVMKVDMSLNKETKP